MTAEYGAFAAYYDRLMADVDYRAWSDYLIDLLKARGVQPGERLLDAACGTGEMTIRLKRAGYLATGADRSGEMLQIAQQKARKAGESVPFIQQELQALSLHKPVSAVTCVCDGVNYLTDLAELDAFLRSAHATLRPKGALLFDVSSAYKLQHVLGCCTYGEDTKDCTYLWQNAFDESSRLLEMNLAFFLPERDASYSRFDERHIQRAYTIEELTNALEKNGFREVSVYGAFTKEAPEKTTERLQFVAQKS